jgi:excinuclease ABC subunit A
VVDRLAQLGGMPPADWSQRSVVRIAAPGDGEAPFFEALTGFEWVISLRFFVPPRTFPPAPDSLAKGLGLAPFHESTPPVPHDGPRVTIRTRRGIGQEITIALHTLAEVRSDSFDAFLREVHKAVMAKERLVIGSNNRARDDLRARLETLPKRAKRVGS